MRNASGTPEPMGGGAPRPGLFVVQQHSARRNHFDFRLEWNGVLKSWAVPRGPSLDPKDKRLAVETEDHPVEYADFEGIIPAGNYGAGAVIVWDRGRWTPLAPVEEGLAEGKLPFELHGYKLRGTWELVRTRGRGKAVEWLLLKKRDGWAAVGRELGPESILSGNTVEEVASGRRRGDALCAELERAGAPKRRLESGEVAAQLAQTGEAPFSRAGWIFELKYDGFRALLEKSGAAGRIVYRRGSDASALFPELQRALGALPVERAILDGEIVCCDAAGVPVFNRLQQRAMLERTADIQRATVELPATFQAFDLLALGDFDLRSLPLVARKLLLKRLLPAAGPIKYTDHVEERGEDLYREVERRGLEGVMAKRADAPYRAGRSADWLKLKCELTGDFVVVGWTAPKRASRVGFASLELAAWEDERWVYVGRVGGGFSHAELAAIRKQLDGERIGECPCVGPVPAERGRAWVEPKRVVEVRFKSWTHDGLLREPRFLRFRDDKRPDECGRHRPIAIDPPAAPTEEAAGPDDRKIAFSNLRKVFWPREGYTKGDLIDYYRAVAPALLHYLRDRPIVVTRFPDGIDGKSFFQHNAPAWTPSWVRRERFPNSEQRDIDYYVCDDVDMLLHVANQAAIPLHAWTSRVARLGAPDWAVLDLDPGAAPFGDVVRIARALHELCDEIGLPSYPKTSGQKGLHVLVPLGGRLTHDQACLLAQLLARVVEQALPDIATTARAIADRKGRVYVDYVQNGAHRTCAVAYSVRPVAGARVSTPLAWDEVQGDLDLGRFTMKTVPARLEALGRDPMAGLLADQPDLARALERLIARQRGAGSGI